MHQPPPILVEVSRDPAVESVHRGSAVVADRRGRAVHAWGDIDDVVYPRSAVKPLQAIPLLATGAARALSVTAEELALACASHGGEPIHTAAIERWLTRLGYTAQQLECGAHAPTDRETRRQLQHRGEAPTPLHNNCSGKHTGFLTLCRHLGVPTSGYIAPGHPVQALVRDCLGAMTGCDLNEAVPGTDGCGIPVYRVPLRGLATAMAKLADPEDLDAASADAARQVREAMVAHPYLVAGRNRFCTRVTQALAPNVLVKTGAEGTYCAAILDQRLGVALKIHDGATRAAEVALGGVLRHLGAIDDKQYAQLREALEPEVRNVAGQRVGRIRAAEELVPVRT